MNDPRSPKVRRVRRARAVLSAALLAASLTLAGCSSVPAECVQQHGKAVAALQSKDKNAFRALVLPAQRSGPLGLSSALNIQSTKKVSALALDDVLDLQFFQEAKQVKINEDLKDLDDKTTARLGVTFVYDDGSVAVRTLLFKKQGNDWLVDLKATLEWWEKLNGADAFSSAKFKKK